MMDERTAMELLRRLVATPSSNIDDKRAILDEAMRPLECLGFDCELVGDRDAPGMIATLGKRGVLFSGHLDTVPVGDGWEKAQCDAVGTTLYGRGTSDMKGGCAAILMAAGQVSRLGLPMSIAFTTDEETKMNAAEEIAKSDVVGEAPAIVVGEPTSVQIGGREKGLLQLRIRTAGKCSHAAMPQEGENAVHLMLDVLTALKDLTPVPSDPMGSMTLNVDVIRGGQKVNVIPDSCEVELDIRTPAGMMPEEALEKVKSRIGNMKCEISVSNRLPPIMTPKDSIVFRTVNEIRPGISTIDIAYATEMVKYAERNTNILALGPGDPKQAHVPNEHVDVREVVEAARIYIELCKRLR